MVTAHRKETLAKKKNNSKRMCLISFYNGEYKYQCVRNCFPQYNPYSILTWASIYVMNNISEFIHLDIEQDLVRGGAKEVQTSLVVARWES